MKTRIISGAVMVAIVASVIFSALYFKLPIILVLFLALISAVASYEMLKGTNIVNNKYLIAAAVLYSAIAQFIYEYLPQFIFVPMAVYAIISLIIVFACELSYKRKLLAVLAPVILSFCFRSIAEILNLGIVHLLLLLNFSSICDTGAYFVGVTMGKHKLCPKISPKKTVEGAIGGLVVSTLVTVLITKIFAFSNMWLMVALTPVFCIFGICGDLSASVIKRRVGIKDYGKIIPGHGGIMDRFDSILLIAPIYVILYSIIW